jgi:predicted DsbA family dithiol-disulfide isomerase
MKIDIWSDIACPWCYIGVTRFERVLAAFPHRDGVEVRLHSFQLDPGLPERYAGTEAQYLAERKGVPAAQVAQMFAQVAGVAAGEGLDLLFDDVVVANSRRAHRLLHAAMAADTGGAVAWDLKKRLFRAHFTEGGTISDPDLLVRLAVEAGLDDAVARAALDSPDREAEVRADIAQASRLGIRGVPFFVLAGKYGISGAQPEETFASALEQAWAEVHPEPLVMVNAVVGDSGAEDTGVACGPDGCD